MGQTQSRSRPHVRGSELRAIDSAMPSRSSQLPRSALLPGKVGQLKRDVGIVDVYGADEGGLGLGTSRRGGQSCQSEPDHDGLRSRANHSLFYVGCSLPVSNRHVRSGPTTGQNCASGMRSMTNDNDQRLTTSQPALFHFVGSCLNDVFDGRSNALRIGRLAGCCPNQLVAAQIVDKGFNLDLGVVAPGNGEGTAQPYG